MIPLSNIFALLNKSFGFLEEVVMDFPEKLPSKTRSAKRFVTSPLSYFAIFSLTSAYFSSYSFWRVSISPKNSATSSNSLLANPGRSSTPILRPLTAR